MPITFPPLVVTGQVISAAYANSQRAAMIASNGEIHTWTQTTNAAGFGIIGLTSVGCDTVAATGTISAGGYSTGGLMTSGTGVCTASFTSPIISAGSLTASGAISANSVATSGPVYVGANLRFTGGAIRYIENESQHMAMYVKSGGSYAFFLRKSDSGLQGGANELNLLQLNEVGAMNLPLSTARVHIGGYEIGNLSVTDVNPVFLMRRSGGAADAKHWDWESSATGLTLRAVNDAYTAATAAMVVTRSSATATGVSFPAGVASPLLLNAEVPGGLEGGQVTMRDALGSGSLILDNYSGGLRLFRSDNGSLMFGVSGTSGRIKISGIVSTTFENQAQAIAAGLVSGEVFWTSTGVLMKV